MPVTEAAPPLDPEEFVSDVIAWRPPTVVGRPDVSGILDLAKGRPATEPGYAFFRLPGWLAEVLNVYDNIGYKPILGVDVCSSTPVYVQILRAHEFSRHGARARELTKTMFGTESISHLKGLGMAELGLTLARNEAGRDLLEAAIQDVLFTMIQPETVRDSHGSNQQLEARFFGKLMTQALVYDETRNDGNLAFKPNQILGPDGRPLNYARALGNMAMLSQDHISVQARRRLSSGLGSEDDYELAARMQAAGLMDVGNFIRWQADYLASSIAGNKRFRIARFFSMDVADPTDIVASSLAHTPAATQETEIFAQALASLYEPRQHIHGNVFEALPFPDNSLALITCFDGFPAGFQLDPKLHSDNEDFGKVALDVLLGWYRKLSPGGKIVIFPWTVYSDTYKEQKANQKVLDAVVVELGRRIHNGVDRKWIPNEVLEEWMSVGDRETSDKLSPVLAQRQPYAEALIINKPKDSSLRSRKRLHRS